MKKKRNKPGVSVATVGRNRTVQRLLSAAILAFVAGCIATLAVKHLWPSQQTAEPPLPEKGLVVCYLHSNTRCEDCQKLELAAQAAVESAAQEEWAGQIFFRAINYESPGNEALVDRYELVAPTIVLVRRDAGKDVAWKSLSEAWAMRGNPQQLDVFLLREIGRFQESP